MSGGWQKEYVMAEYLPLLEAAAHAAKIIAYALVAWRALKGDGARKRP